MPFPPDKRPEGRTCTVHEKCLEEYQHGIVKIISIAQTYSCRSEASELPQRHSFRPVVLRDVHAHYSYAGGDDGLHDRPSVHVHSVRRSIVVPAALLHFPCVPSYDARSDDAEVAMAGMKR